jgi:hypothetical protein
MHEGLSVGDRDQRRIDVKRELIGGRRPVDAIREKLRSAFPVPEWALRLHKGGGGIPYGLAICAGGLLVFPKTEIFRALIV